MISRRNIRVKVMQSLYVLKTIEGETTGKKVDPVLFLKKQFDATEALFIYQLYFINQLAQFAEIDSRQKASKNLPSAADLNVNTKIAGNQLVWKILESVSYRTAIEQYKPGKQINTDLVKKLYNQLVATETYQNYILENSRTAKEDLAIIQFLYNDFLLQNEDYITAAEEHFSNWEDDAEMIQQLMLNYLQKPNSNLQQMITSEKWQYAKDLLTTVLGKEEHVLELIKPKLRNWDMDRVAQLDMLMLQMGVCELLYFETIPTKVTINEYIDIAKEYSTPQSGQFINGILDNIHKELVVNGTINKVEYKKK
jgi:transcription antitermination protein NusB